MSVRTTVTYPVALRKRAKELGRALVTIDIDKRHCKPDGGRSTCGFILTEAEWQECEKFLTKLITRHRNRIEREKPEASQ